MSLVPPAPSPATFWPCGCRVVSSGGRPGPLGGTGSGCGSLRARENRQPGVDTEKQNASKMPRVTTEIPGRSRQNLEEKSRAAGRKQLVSAGPPAMTVTIHFDSGDLFFFVFFYRNPAWYFI